MLVSDGTTGMVNMFDGSVNIGLDPQFQAQLLIMTLDKVNEDNYYQYDHQYYYVDLIIDT